MRTLLTSLLCVFTLSLTAQVDCPNTYDGNADGAVTINDLLDLLSVFGDTDTDSDGIWDSIDDCIDLTACNYSNDPTEPCTYIDVLGVCGGGCEGDSDGDDICDDIDDCIGVVDECGVCNGPGATEIVIESITILYDSLYAEQIDEWWVFEVGADTAFTYVCPNIFQSCGDLISHDGYDYSTVQIGEQCWFSENCRYLPEVSPYTIEGSQTEPYYYVLNYQGTDLEAAKETESYETIGVLYNYPAVMTEGLCPSGWYIPLDEDWMELEMSLGMSESEAADTGWRGADEGYKMKSTSGWINSDGDGLNGSNSSGFNCLSSSVITPPNVSGCCCAQYWRPASESADSPWKMAFCPTNDNVNRSSSDPEFNNGYETLHWGFSARCVRD